MPDQIKNQLINELWLPMIKKGGNIFYPRLRKNKNLRVLTLTTDTNFEEISTLVEEKLTQRDRIIAWTHSHIKKFRLETEIAPSTVFGAIRYEDAISSSSFPLNNHFPFDVIILDFSSQSPVFDQGRIEKEVTCVEKTITIQKDSGNHGFVLVYTTILNSNNLNLEAICSSSNDIPVHGWQGLVIDGYPSSLRDNDQKINCIEGILGKVSQKYNYVGQFEKKRIPLQEQKAVFSITGLLRGDK